MSSRTARAIYRQTLSQKTKKTNKQKKEFRGEGSQSSLGLDFEESEQHRTMCDCAAQPAEEAWQLWDQSSHQPHMAIMHPAWGRGALACSLPSLLRSREGCHGGISGYAPGSELFPRQTVVV